MEILLGRTLSGGMGVLTDVTFGSKDVRRPKGWIGWNRNLVTTPYIVFEFEKTAHIPICDILLQSAGLIQYYSIF